jgi:hypothetical protein
MIKATIIVITWFAVGALIYYWRRGLRTWIVGSVGYPLRMRSLLKRYKTMTDMDILSHWQNNLVDRPERYWFNRRMERHIRLKIINKILKI